MNKIILSVFLCLFMFVKISAQTTGAIEGTILESNTETPLGNVSISLQNTVIQTISKANGSFKLANVPVGKAIIEIAFEGHQIQKIPVEVKSNKTINLGVIYLELTVLEDQNANLISLSDDDLLDDGDSGADYISGLFQSSKDAFLKAAAFNFSQAWFKVRGYDSSYGAILINGIKMNKLYDGRPQWSDWGGLNDVFRNQEFSNGLATSDNTFGALLGTTNFSTRASKYRAGGKVSITSTNKSYTGRAMATYATGLNDKKWAMVVSASRRIADQGYLNGTSYNAYSAFLATEKKFNKHHSLNFTAILSANRRGKSSPNTQEVYDLKGYKYNAYWGTQGGDKRNARIKEIEEPILMLTHYYQTDNTKITTILGYQFGHIGNSRLGYFNAPNPDPTYWRNLPSSYLRFQDNLDYANAYLAEQNFLNDGQLNWNNLYQVNANTGNSSYYLYEDRVDDNQFSFQSNITSSLSKNSIFNGGISYRNLNSTNYANMLDLLGGTGFEDLDQYAVGDAQQNDLNNPNRTVVANDKFQYNYNINASVASAFAQLQVTQKKIDYFVSLNFKNTNYQREGLYKNGTYATNSFGKSKKLSFSDFNIKGGITYKINGRNLININGGLLSNAPTIRTSFSNSRVNNEITPDLTSEKIISGDISYIFRAPGIQTRLTGYYTKFTNAIETSFFFAEGLRGDQADFVNEITTGVAKKNIGVELSAEYQITSTIKLIAAGSLGQFTYDNNPHLYIQSESFTDENSDFGTAYLKNYKISGTPQRAYSLGFEYRDPAFWWFQANANYMTNNYINISPLLRTNNFYTDADGVPFIDDQTGVAVTQNQVNDLLKQEKFSDAFLVNLVGGKSWRIKSNYIGFFMGINNVLGELFKTGGFEQSRNANYPQLKEDKQLDKPIFGPKYWYGNKTAYYLNVYLRF
ncbi:TonB-dependent receptor [Lutibacter sp.]|uniref:TonB-dependent receptor n=1 Tax=Lutibacter sp. TaxID=1925666 RepID=UPI0025C543EF|nr:TonB-dependent receptor [Lutibacter sp.]MCF6182758.1 TonB-dependent receptor [Lutibacter sp.]